jgi:hypothetical protein
VGRAVAVVALLALAVYLYAVGLDKAGVLAGIVGLFVAMAGLLAPYLLPSTSTARRQPHAAADDPPEPGHRRGGGYTDLRGAQGVQNGNYNQQFNDFRSGQ